MQQIGLYTLFLAQQKPEGQPEKEGAGDHDPLGCGEERPDEELEGGLLKVLEDEDEAAYHGYADKDELGIFPETLQTHSITPLRIRLLEIWHAQRRCVNMHVEVCKNTS